MQLGQQWAKRNEKRNRPQSIWHLTTQIEMLSPGLLVPPRGQVVRRRRRAPSSWGRGHEPVPTRSCAETSALSGWSRPSRTQARARKFQAGTVTPVSAFLPKPARPLPLVNFSRELTRHFRAASTRGRGRTNQPRAPWPEVSALYDAFPPPTNERRRFEARGGGSSSQGGVNTAGNAPTVA